MYVFELILAQSETGELFEFQEPICYQFKSNTNRYQGVR